ncbi:hypothetical protein [Phenylobacterium sp.]|jgi:hypothetical protein|uniref:hypothetical protein n=1 Tax=Phenylobacterium sp. TaxID=1871053 RepID=UPI0037851024
MSKPVIEMLVLAGFVAGLLGFMSCWLVMAAMTVPRLPRSLRAGWEFNARRRTETLEPEGLTVKPADWLFLKAFLRIWLIALAFFALGAASLLIAQRMGHPAFS